MANQLFARKPLEMLLEELHGENRLRRVLGPVQLTALGVGCIIGTGIFVLTGRAAHDTTGPALMLSFVAAGTACIFAALCYAEFASMVPVAGSAYTVCLRHSRGALRLDHRLGSNSGVFGFIGHGSSRLVALSSGLILDDEPAPAACFVASAV